MHAISIVIVRLAGDHHHVFGGPALLFGAYLFFYSWLHFFITSNVRHTVAIAGFPTLLLIEFNKGDQIGIVTDKKSSLSKWIFPEAIFGKDFAVDAKEKADKKVVEQLSHPDKGA